MAAELGPTGVGRHRKTEHVPKHRLKEGNHRRSVERPEPPHPRHSPSHPLSATRAVSSMPTDVGLTDMAGTTHPDYENPRVSRSLSKLESRKALDSFVKDRENAGCVVRAIESAFNAKASIQETETRLADIRDMQENGELKNEDLRAEDIRRASAYFENLKTHDSPLGVAMRDYKLSVKEMTLEQIKEATLNGEKVLASIKNQYKGVDIWHLMHVDYFESTGRVVDMSDKGSAEVSGPSYLCFAFARTSEAGNQQAA